MSAGDDDDIRAFRGIELAHGLVELERMNFARCRKTFFGRIGAAVIADDHVETSVCGNLANIQRHMACAEEIKRGWRQYRLDKNFERASADQAGIEFRILIKIEAESARLFRFHNLARGLPDVSFDAAATDGAD